MNHANEIRAFVVSNFLFGDAGSLRDDTSFMEGGIIDSTGILELVTFLESAYPIKIEAEEMLPKNLDSVNSVARFLAGKLSEKTAPSAPSPGQSVSERVSAS
jgi:acyl carrier protein